MKTLGLPIRASRAAWITTAIVLAIDLATMARDLTFYDSAELALVAHELGLGHPIGQPLHTWLGFVFAHLPGVDPILGLTAMSAIFGALCVLPAWSLAERLAGEVKWFVVAPVVIAFALHPIAWEPASRVEVYTLAAFLSLAALARAASNETRAWPVGLLLGLAAGANAVIALAHGLALLPRVVRIDRRPRELALFVAAGLAGLLPFVHIFAVASDRARFVWGAPETPPALLAYLRGADYAHNAGIDAGGVVDHLVDLARWSVFEASLPLALLGLAAHLWRGKDGLRWALPIAAGLSILFVARNLVFHVDVPDYRGYLLAPWMAAGAGVAALASVLAARGGRFRIYGALVALMPLVALALSPSHVLAGPRDEPSLARAMIRGALAEAPPNAVLVVEADHWVAPLLFAQEAEGARPDVVVLAHGLASSRWYWEHLFVRHPTLEAIELAGPGGRDGRIRRLLERNPDRPVLTETFALAAAIDARPCGAGWLIWTGEACRRGHPRPSAATERIERIRPRRGEALEVAARVSFARGEALWRLGHGREAYRALLAGIDAALPFPAPRPSLPDLAPRLGGALPAWSRRAALHDPARNVFLAARLLDASRSADAPAVLDLARRMGLPEAQR